MNKLTKRGVLGMMLMLAALWLAPSAARAAARHVRHAKTHVVHQRKAVASRAAGASLQHVTYKYKKTAVRKRRAWRRRRVWRHRVTLPRQPSRDRTEQIQQALERAGYYTGDPNGKWDYRMTESLRRFQTANGLPPTGKLDALSLEKMGLGADTAGVGAPRTTAPENPAAAPSSPGAPKTPGK